MDLLLTEIRQQKKFGRLTPLQGTNLTTVFGKRYVKSLGLSEENLDRMRLFVEYNKLHYSITGVVPDVTNVNAYLESAEALEHKLGLFSQNMTKTSKSFSQETLHSLLQQSRCEFEASRPIEWFILSFRQWNKRCRASPDIISAVEMTRKISNTLSETDVYDNLQSLSSACFDRKEREEFHTVCSKILPSANLSVFCAPDDVVYRFGEYAKVLLDCESGDILPRLCEFETKEDCLFGTKMVCNLLLCDPTVEQLEELYLLFSDSTFSEFCVTPADRIMIVILSRGISAMLDALLLRAITLSFVSDQRILHDEVHEIVSIVDSIAILAELFGFSYGTNFDNLCELLDELSSTKTGASPSAFWQCTSLTRPWMPTQQSACQNRAYKKHHGVIQSRTTLANYSEAEHQMYHKWLGVTSESTDNPKLDLVYDVANDRESAMLDITRQRLQKLHQKSTMRKMTTTNKLELKTPEHVLKLSEDEWDDCWSYSDL